MKKFYALLCCSVLLSWNAKALCQEISAENYKLWNSNIVEIHGAGNKSGGGFIIAEKEGLIYIVTAAHVVEGMDEVPVNLISNRNSGKGTVIKRNSFYDIALITISGSEQSWKAFSYISNPAGGDPVFCISLRNDRSIISAAGSAIITSINKELIESSVGIKEGDSGTPLFNSQGIVGLIIKYPGVARPVSLIKGLVEGWDMPWQLPELSINRNSAAEKIPDVSKEEMLPVEFILDEENNKIITELNDDDLSSNRIYSDKGSHNLLIKLKDNYTFNRIKIYSPPDLFDDSPPGYIYLPKSKQKFRFNAVKSPVMEKAGSGNWIIYDLKHFYHEDQIKLTFRLRTDSKSNPEPFAFYEIKVLGPQQ
ncbi:MAG: serine protease [Sphingobacteriaceae bacterium]|nr:MAG: serine protease [Sphingobacteriaceae bacterium]